MDRRQQLEAGHRLDTALRKAGLVIERGEFERGNLRKWTPVDGASVVGRLMAVTGWRVRRCDEEPSAEPPPTRELPFQLVDGGDVE